MPPARRTFSPPLLLRLFLAPIFILAGLNKLGNVEAVAWWFDSIGFPAPTLMVYLAGLLSIDYWIMKRQRKNA